MSPDQPSRPFVVYLSKAQTIVLRGLYELWRMGLLSVCELLHRHADAKLSTSPEDIFVDSVNAQLSLEWWDFLGDLEDEDED